MKVKPIKPVVGGRYRSQDKEFIITALPKMYDDKWVEYTDAKNKTDYYCRLDAFLERFSPLVD
ncbi:hypothetical protein UFOVP181_44 [uncultured Caudovirales phage]|uniref:DUF1653 domain-containing protein n=1 Tax=uncultured Caudovirales phage TaxID=2100421 RepID=A0A6J5KSF4_9CAUD|nr:hypothetical protein UFOVP57_118 [uncultured Caudovirales phage]CAB5208485.1 hypothetical protein UFOVP181_44 [uncultured Caudovirales phage]